LAEDIFLSISLGTEKVDTEKDIIADIMIEVMSMGIDTDAVAANHALLIFTTVHMAPTVICTVNKELGLQ